MTTHSTVFRSIHKTVRIACLASAASLLAACAGMESAGPKATAALESRSGSTVSGTVNFYASGEKLRVEARIAGLTPGEHGFHVHEAGDCSAPDASSAKGHFNPAAKQHGHYSGAEHHAGDMPNLVADSYGNATVSGEVTILSLGSDANSILNRSVVIHADPDDYKSQPAGNSGKRVACGTIRAVTAGSRY